MAAEACVAAKTATTMLNSGIHRAYCQDTAGWEQDNGVRALASGGAAAEKLYGGQPMLFATTARHFIASANLLDEVFGPAALLIECANIEELFAVAKHLDGQLTATLHMTEQDSELARALMPTLERKAGRFAGQWIFRLGLR